MHLAKQKGFTLMGLIIVFAIIGMITLSILKVFPVYMVNMAVKKSLEAIETDHGIKTMSVGQIRGLFEKKLDMNQVTSIRAKDAKINRSISDITVKVEYEVRKDYIGNIDLILSFSDEFEVAL